MNPLSTLDSSVNPQSSFWQTASPPPNETPPSFVGSLQVAEGHIQLVECQLALVGKMLYKYEGDWDFPTSISVVELTWKVAELFSEDTGSEVVCGFCLSYRRTYVEFYAEDEATLVNWAQQLGKICVLTGFVNEFELIKNIGEGSSAKVWTARCFDDEELYAVKLYSKDKLLRSSQVLEQLRSEVEALRLIKHPNVLKMYSVFDLPDSVGIVMEYFPCGTLARRLRSRRVFSEANACKLVGTLLETIESIHSQGVVHRDLKLENILMVSEDDDTDFRIADFGLAGFGYGQIHSQRGGSPGYIAPEIIEGEKYDHRVDFFSIGVVLYTLLAGKLPFSGSTMRSILELNRLCKVIFASNDLMPVSILAISILKALINPNPQARPSASEFMSSVWFKSFIPSINPSQAHSAGYSPRLVKSPKLVLRKVSGSQVLCFRDMPSMSSLSSIQRKKTVRKTKSIIFS
jgi:serine/threonine protein kinase